MKKIKYLIYQSTFENGDVITLPKEILWSEVNEEIAKSEAYNGEYTIEDDGQPEPEAEASTDDVLDAMLGVM